MVGVHPQPTCSFSSKVDDDEDGRMMMGDEQASSEKGFVYHDPQREGGSGFSDTLLPATQTSGKSVSDKIRFQKRTSFLVRNKRASSGCS